MYRPANRFVALLYAVLMERIQWADEEKRKAVVDALDWPDVAEERQEAEAMTQIQESFATLGITVDFDAIARQAEEHEARMRAEAEDAGNNDPVAQSNDA